MSENNNVIVSICGPSTSGKTILSQLLKDDGLSGVVTTTTRPKRAGEIHGVNYYFVSEDEFDKMKENGQLLENVKVNGYQYGVSIQGLVDALKKDNDSVIVLEPEGANILERYCSDNGINNLKVYVNNPMEVLIARLQERFKTDSKANPQDYKDRLFDMVFFEPEAWTAKAINKEHNYHLLFETFDSNNTELVLQEVKSYVNRFKKNVKPSPK